MSRLEATVRPVPENIAISRDWWTAGWNTLLPRQALFLHIAVATATVDDIDGAFPALVEYLGTDTFDRDTGGLDGPVWWSVPDEENDQEQVELDARAQSEFETAMSRAGRIPPTTVFQLAVLMADLGVFLRSAEGGVERWRSPEILPLAAERLPLSAEWTARQDQFRWTEAHEESAQRIIRYVVDELDCPESLLTTLSDLAENTDLELEDLRFGLVNLLDSGFTLRSLAGSDSYDPETVSGLSELRIDVDWKTFNDERIRIRFTDPDDDES